MSHLPANSIDLVFADPPFNIGYLYDEHKDNMTARQYQNFTRDWLDGVRRVISPTGSVFVAIGDDYAAQMKVWIEEYRGVLSKRLRFRNWIIWKYTFGVYCPGNFGRDHTHILYYTADPKRFTFNADAVRVPSLRQTVYKDKRANPKGRVPGDVWEFSRVCGTFKERTGHPCQMPEALLERIVLACSNPGDTVLDPFAGSGTTLVAAVRHGRKAIGFEKSENYHRMAVERLQKLG